MPYGAHEAMEAHEILCEKTLMIEHFAMYAGQAQDPSLRNMLEHHITQAARSYDELVSYTHDYHAVTPQAPHMAQMATPQSIQYGLRNPAPAAPQMHGGRMSDEQIAASMLCAHKNSAKNHLAAALECADPHLRQMMVNGANQCAFASYEVFRYMNHHGWYQVPTLQDNTAKTMLHHHQPITGSFVGAAQRQGMHMQSGSTQRSMQMQGGGMYGTGAQAPVSPYGYQ